MTANRENVRTWNREAAASLRLMGHEPTSEVWALVAWFRSMFPNLDTPVYARIVTLRAVRVYVGAESMEAAVAYVGDMAERKRSTDAIIAARLAEIDAERAQRRADERASLIERLVKLDSFHYQDGGVQAMRERTMARLAELDLAV